MRPFKDQADFLPWWREATPAERDALVVEALWDEQPHPGLAYTRHWLGAAKVIDRMVWVHDRDWHAANTASGVRWSWWNRRGQSYSAQAADLPEAVCLAAVLALLGLGPVPRAEGWLSPRAEKPAGRIEP